MTVLLGRRAFLGATAAFTTSCAAEGTFVPLAIERPAPPTLDADPRALLPRGPVFFGDADATAIFATPLARDLAEVVDGLVPVAAEGNLVASRDVRRISGGIYAMQGADHVAVLSGAFDGSALRAAAVRRRFVVTPYAGFEIVTFRNAGFVALTAHTLLAGSETGLRRSLDRLRRPWPSRGIPSFFASLPASPGASFSFGADLAGQPVEAFAGRMPFVAKLRLVRMLGNVRGGRVNVVGALSYPDTPSADAGAVGLRNAESLARFWGGIFSLGFSTFPPLDLAVTQSDVDFAVTLDEGFARSVLRTVAGGVRGFVAG